MIYLKNTPNYTGVTFFGDNMDFDELYEALHTIVGEEGDLPSYEGARLRVLAVCYDLRHSLMGNREVEFVGNGLHQDMMKHLSIVTNDQNVYFAFNVLWPELLFVTMALNDFVRLYAKKQAKNSYNPVLEYRNIWDPAIAQVRLFQAAIAKCIKETISEASFSRTMKLMNKDYTWCANYATQYLDELNCDFIAMDKEKRLKNITIMAKRIAEEGRDYQEVKTAVLEAARKYNCSITNIKSIVEYPEDIEW
ncbi:hypothetical protein ABES02_26245 [Neobacillus pocheonensis]|uniref:DUF6904 family protein n=1 Tax=Neobacillus pocheonensis TaxID=363869 RepID=UPI003D26D9F4